MELGRFSGHSHSCQTDRYVLYSKVRPTVGNSAAASWVLHHQEYTNYLLRYLSLGSLGSSSSLESQPTLGYN
jgi:hypothetical protein